MVRQILTEVLLLASVGGLAGLGLSRLTSGWLMELVPSTLPRQSEVGVDGTVFFFTLVTVLVATLVAGLVPSLQAMGRASDGGLRQGGRGALQSRSHARLNRAIVVSQLGLAVILLFGAGLLVRSFHALRSVDPGFTAEDAFTARLTLPGTRYADPEPTVAFFDRLTEQVASLPGVTQVALAMDHPLENTWWNGFTFPDRPAPDPDERPRGIFRPVSAGYFSALGVPVVEGREFQPGDRLDQPGVMVVNEAFARRYFPDQSPLAERVRFTVGTFIWGSGANTLFEIVGVVGDVRFNGLKEASEPAFYIPLHQFPYQTVTAIAVTEAEPESLTRAFQAEVWSLDPNLPVTDARSLKEILAVEMARDRFNLLLLGAFALAALVLAAAGIYGVLSYMVSRRTGEMGVRMAVGAHPASVMSLVVRDAGAMAGLGLLIGLAASLALSRFVAALLFGVSPNDPAILVGVALVLGLVAIASGAVPAYRAARTDPMEALRAE